MTCKEFFRPTKVKVIYIITISLIIIVSAIFARNGVMCIKAPCPQPIYTVIGQFVYYVTTFFSAARMLPLQSLILSLILHYLLICIIVSAYNHIKLKNKE